MINLIIDILKADANITAITTTDRIYPVSRLEGGVIPAIVVQLTNTDPADTHDNTTNMDAHTVQVSVIEDRPKEAHALAELCRAALDGYSGGTIAECRFVNQATDVFESIDLYTQTMLFRVMLVRDNVTLPTALADLGIFELDDVSDVSLDEPLDREALVYDEATTSWINGGPAKVDVPVFNNTFQTITKGQVIQFGNSAQGDRMGITLFSATSINDPKGLIGIASENIPAGEPGHVRSYGTIYGINTNAYPVGTILYASVTDGQLTSTVPTAPNHRIAIAVVTRQHVNTGRIFVRTYTPAFRLADLSNVASTSPTTGQALSWDGSKWAPANVGYIPGSPPPGGFLGNVFYQDNAGNFTQEDAFSYNESTNTLAVENITGSTVTGTGVVKGSNTFGQRYATQAATNRALADTASITVERYFTVTAEGNGESFNIQSNTPSSGNKIVRKIWYKDEAFEATDVDTWTLLHTFADDTAYASTETQWDAYLEGQTYGKPPFTLALSWEDIPVFTGLLDTYSGAAAAYSVRLLDKDYAGDCIRVRRASDNTEQDIGFDASGDLDTTALATFCSGTDGFVKTWYDQSGNANDATQTTTGRQPKIYDSVNGIEKDTNNQKPIVRRTLSNDAMYTDYAYNVGFKRSAVFVGEANTSLSSFCIIGAKTSGYEYAYVGQNGSTSTAIAQDATLSDIYLNGSQQVFSNRGSVYDAFAAGPALLFSNIDFQGSDTLALGYYASVNPLNVGMADTQEFVLWEADIEVSSRTGIEANINAYYSIYP